MLSKLKNLFKKDNKSNLESQVSKFFNSNHRDIISLISSDINSNDYQEIRDGFLYNVIAFACVNMISDAISSLKVSVYENKKDSKEKVFNTELNQLIKRPNYFLTKTDFIQQVFISYLVTGNAYIKKVFNQSNSKVIGLEVLPSHNVTVVSGDNDNFPAYYLYTPVLNGAKAMKFLVNQENGRSGILHFKSYNPLNKLQGLSPLAVASGSVKTHNKGIKWNYNLLLNHGKHSHYLINKNPYISPEERQKLEEIQNKESGYQNAGKSKILDGDFDIKTLSMSPVDMDFANSLKTALDNICFAYKINPDLLTGAAKYNNYQVAMEDFYTTNIIDRANNFYEQLSLFLDKSGQFEYQIETENISALEFKRERRINRLIKQVQGSIITINEARDSLDLEPFEVEEANQLLINKSYITLDSLDIEETLNNIDSSNNSKNGN